MQLISLLNQTHLPILFPGVSVVAGGVCRVVFRWPGGEG